MLIELMFELKGPGPTGSLFTLITGCFHHKTIISNENIPVDCLFTAEILQEAMYFISPYVGQITYKIQPQNARF